MQLVRAYDWYWSPVHCNGTGPFTAPPSSGRGRDGSGSPVYWGAWLAVGWICLEGALSPFLWRDLRTPGTAEIRMLRGVLLFATTVVYLLSRNFWLAWFLRSDDSDLGTTTNRFSGSWDGNKKSSWQ